MKARNVSRREFVRLLVLSSAGAALASCAPQLPAPSGATPAAGVLPPTAAAPPTAASVASMASPTAAAAGKRPVIRLAGGAAQGLFEPPQPFGFRTGPAFARMSFLFDALTWRDSTTNPMLWLAEKWTPNADGTQWYFTPLWNPLPLNKQAFVTGQKTGTQIRR